MKKDGLIAIAIAVATITVATFLIGGSLHTPAVIIGGLFGGCMFAFGLVVFFDKPLQGKQYE